ncbi:histidinol dehydrogenase-domain-containing protein [Obelidium mucronatum]|nr:histidinol dehydrogenase-domain-containing protein [Obelidium mucronatum]
MFILQSTEIPTDGIATIAAPVLVPSSAVTGTVASGVSGGHGVWSGVDGGASVADVCTQLDRGAARVVVDAAQFAACVGAGLPGARLAVRVAALALAPPGAPVVVLEAPLAAVLDAAFAAPKNVRVVLAPTDAASAAAVTEDVVARLDRKDVDVLLPLAAAAAGFDVGRAFALCLATDRPDALFATAIVDEFGVCLGVAYSSVESLSHTLKTGQGAYQSRSRGGLWVKGLTSGATQKVYQVDRDCDKDTVRFIVHQTDPGFCHLNTRTCFGTDTGLTALESTLLSRKASAPPGSYTARLFNDTTLLHAKIREEAGELCDATTPDHIASEAADVIYFALTKCVANGVGLKEIEAHLERRAKKVTRRAGDAKPGDLEKEKALEEEKKKKAAVAAAAPAPAAAPVAETKLAIQMKVHDHASLSSQDREQLLQRPIYDLAEISSRVKPIIANVEANGDAALIELTSKFDRVELTSVVLKAPFPESLMDEVKPNVKAAIDQAFDNIHKFHAAQLGDKDSVLSVETMPGVVCSRFSRPIERVGLYVPGGTAILPSTTMMLGVPAMVAGCKEIVVASPPRKDGTPVPEVVYVANKIGASTIVLAGGAQAIAAMAYGTKSVPKVDKIVGPGNQYVTAAKMALQNDTKAMISIDMPAGPSELLVIADNDSNPAYVVSDLLSQAEHGVDSQVILVAIAPTEAFIASIQKELDAQGEALPRNDIVRISISKSYILKVQTREEALTFSNKYAPEHLILHIEEPEKVIESIDNAGSVFVGPWSPESLGDYASGTNHTLPTYGYARMYSGVNTDTFLKHITSQTVTRDGLDLLGDVVTTLAEVEGLEAHRNAVAIRLKDIRAGRV